MKKIMVEKNKKYHDFYLCEIEPEEGSGYKVKQQVKVELVAVLEVHPLK